MASSFRLKQKMMKILGFIGILLILAGCKTETGYQVKGHLEGAPEGTVVYLGEDSTTIVNGNFIFRGKVEAPVLAELKISSLNEYGYPDFKGTLLWINNENLQVECPWEQLSSVYGYTDRMKVSGSELNDLYRSYQKQAAQIGSSRDSLWKIYQKAYLEPLLSGETVDVETGMRVMREMRAIAAGKRQLAQAFIAKHPASPASVDVLSWQLTGQNYTVAEAQQMINSLDTTLSIIPAYQDLMDAFEAFRGTAKGEKYMDAVLKDQNGKEVKLSEVIQPGKYNMLEFWASWCGPCRGEIPHLRHVNEVVGNDFNIISISIDEDSDAWKKAMKEENMIWTQLLDELGWDGGVAEMYRVQGVPYSLLLDGEGRIVDGDLRGAELDIVLEELLGEKAKNL